MSDYILLALCCFAVGCIGGWADAHSTVSSECDKLGSFYVGSKIYECKEKAK